ncbi:MAG: DinB family protein [Thermomicrobiales bacterium]
MPFSSPRRARSTEHVRTTTVAPPLLRRWARYQQHLVAAIAPLTAEQLSLRTTPRHWTIRMYATHIIANRAWWFHARMGEGGDEVTPYELWALDVCEADVDPGHTAAELVAGLEQTWRLIEETLARLTPTDLARTVPPLDEAGRERRAKLVEPRLQPYARMWLEASRRTNVARPAVPIHSIVWGILEHDIHHGSEISTTLGIHGLPVLDLDD